MNAHDPDTHKVIACAAECASSKVEWTGRSQKT
jgi:hypothetical protein